MYYYNARWYDADTGRFISEDPARDGQNWYGYVSNNPLKYIDPTGMRLDGDLDTDLDRMTRDAINDREKRSGNSGNSGDSDKPERTDDKKEQEEEDLANPQNKDNVIPGQEIPEKILEIILPMLDEIAELNPSMYSQGNITPTNDLFNLTVGGAALSKNFLGAILSGGSMTVINAANGNGLSLSKTTQGMLLGSTASTLSSLFSSSQIGKVIADSLIGGSASVTATAILDGDLTPKSAFSSFTSGAFLSGGFSGLSELGKVAKIPGVRYMATNTSLIDPKTSQPFSGQVISNQGYRNYNFMVGEFANPALSSIMATSGGE